MYKQIKTASITAFVLGCTLALAACGGGSSQATGIIAHTDIPESVYAGSSSTISVSLAATGLLAQGKTASVQMVDVGSTTPLVDCGSARTIGIGSSGSFHCQAPQVDLGMSNEHQIQVEVDGKPNLPSPVPVYVENGGRVHAELTNASGAPVDEVEPGDTFYVSFETRTPSHWAASGRYAVSAPGGWLVGGDGGACTVTASYPACEVAVTVPADAAAGSYGLDFDDATGSSLLSPYLLVVGVKASSVGAARGANSAGSARDPLSLYVSQNISDTVYKGSQFAYKPVFLFKNTSSQPLDLSAATVQVQSGLASTGLQFGCVPQPDKAAVYTYSGCTTLAPFDSTTHGPLFAVTGDLIAPAAAMGTASVAFTISNPSGALAAYRKDVAFVPYVAGHVAIRVTAPASGTAFYAAASMEKWNDGKTPPDYIIKFSEIDGYYVGKISTIVADGAYDKNQVRLSQAHSTLFYIPHGQSGVMYLNRGKITTAHTPTHTTSLTPPRWLRLEMSYGGKGAKAGAEILYLDQSYVNAIGVMAAFNVIGKASPLSLYSQDTTHGILSRYLELDDSRHVFRAMAKEFARQHDSSIWKYDCQRQDGVQNYVRASFSGSGKTCTVNYYTQILAPITVANVVLSADGRSYYLDPMRTAGPENGAQYAGSNHYYNSYVKALWKYFRTNPMYVDTVLAQSKSTGDGISGCIVKGAVATSGDHDKDLVFTRFSGTCPTSKGPSGSNTVTAADPLVFAKFLPCDFLQSAGSADCNTRGTGSSQTQAGLYGVSDSYRAAVGEAIAAYQAAGLLPLCPGSIPAGLNLEKTSTGKIIMTKANARAIMESGAGFSNPTCLSKVSSRARPLWNVYAAILGSYDNVYSYSYGDYLGASGTVNFSPPSATAAQTAWFDSMGKVAQPVTVKIIQ